MSATAYLTKLSATFQGSDEERECAKILFTEIDVPMNDQRLNHLAALTYNMIPCQRIFAMIEKGIEKENPWKTIYKSLLLLHTIILYGAESAIDKCVDMCKFIHPLQQYNSALVKKGFFSSGGTDYGAPVRAEANIITTILMKDDNIRRARMEARSGQDSLVPLGHREQTNPSQGLQFNYGQAVSSSVGAGFALENVPGMYDGRPERYFDNSNDPRSRTTQGNSQITRDKLAPSLLDLAFDDMPAATSSNLPPPDYLPALEKQKELERQLAEQQELLRKLQEQQQQPAPQQYQDPLLSLQMPTVNQMPNNAYGMQQSYPNNQMGGSSMGMNMPYNNNQSSFPNQMGAAPAPMMAQNNNAIDLLDMGFASSAPSMQPPAQSMNSFNSFQQPQQAPMQPNMQSSMQPNMQQSPYGGVPGGYNPNMMPGAGFNNQPPVYGAMAQTNGMPPAGMMPNNNMVQPNNGFSGQPGMVAGPNGSMGYGMSQYPSQQYGATGYQPMQAAPQSVDLLGFNAPPQVTPQSVPPLPIHQIGPNTFPSLNSPNEQTVLKQFNAQYNTPYASPPPPVPGASAPRSSYTEHHPTWSFDFAQPPPMNAAPPIPGTAPQFESAPMAPPPPVPSMPPPADFF